MSCLRPAPPTRSYIMPDGKKTVRKKGISHKCGSKSEMPKHEKVSPLPDPDSTYEEDMQILRVIEAYCTTNKRQTQAQLGKITQIPLNPLDVIYKVGVID